MSQHERNRGMLWGLLLAHLEGTRSVLGRALRDSRELLDEEDHAKLQVMLDTIAGVEQRAVAAQQAWARGKRA